MTTVNIPSKAQGAFQGNMSDRAKIELPFPAPAFYIVNGDPNLEELKNAQYYGGWAASSESIKEAAEKWEGCPFPIPSFTEKELRPKGGKGVAIRSHIIRSLVVAPIGMREFSVKTDPSTKHKTRVAPFTKGARPAIQVLVMLGYMGDDKKSIHSWAPAMLTANGFQTNHVKRAFQNWRNAIKPHMEEVAPGVPDDVTNLFWMNIGTFGSERFQEDHGESSITPVAAYIPENITPEQVASRYVGAEIAEFMADMSIKARDWLKAYAGKTESSQADPGEPVHVNDELTPEDDIPF